MILERYKYIYYWQLQAVPYTIMLCIVKKSDICASLMKRNMFSSYEIHFNGLEIVTINWNISMSNASFLHIVTFQFATKVFLLKMFIWSGVNRHHLHLVFAPRWLGWPSLAGHSFSDSADVVLWESLLVPPPLARGREQSKLCGCLGLYGVVICWCFLNGLLGVLTKCLRLLVCVTLHCRM